MQQLTPEELMRIAATGQELNLAPLTEECLKEIANKMDAANAPEILEFASKYDFNDLRAKCQKLI
ncbi:MAG: hypothetical protein JHC93_04135 [Parachlamydiales bacterium]|nr:hypothetical protein [Parachlamydiales bacterium]